MGSTNDEEAIGRLEDEMEETNNSKIINFSVLATAFLTGIVVRVVFESLAANFGVVGRAWGQTYLQHGIPLALGALVFAILRFNPKVVAFLDDVIVEVKKVVWPTRRDTTAMTTVSVVMLIVAGVVLGVFDVLSKYVVEMILSI